MICWQTKWLPGIVSLINLILTNLFVTITSIVKHLIADYAFPSRYWFYFSKIKLPYDTVGRDMWLDYIMWAMPNSQTYGLVVTRRASMGTRLYMLSCTISFLNQDLKNLFVTYRYRLPILISRQTPFFKQALYTSWLTSKQNPAVILVNIIHEIIKIKPHSLCDSSVHVLNQWDFVRTPSWNVYRSSIFRLRINFESKN